MANVFWQLRIAYRQSSHYILRFRQCEYAMPSAALYADLSHYYDLLCSNIDYHEQCEFGRRANRLWGNGGRRYLDLACGSGALLTHFSAAGYACSGLDLSAEMLALAAARCPQATLFCTDMGNIPAAHRVDFVTCFLYSIHYCASISALQHTLHQVYATLAPGGLFCFDAVDKDRIVNDHGHRHRVELPECELRFQTRWHYSGMGDRLDLHVDIRELIGSRERHYAEQHAMTAIKVTTLQRMLEGIGFEVVVLEHDFARFLPWQGASGNVIFCATKPVHATPA